MVNGEVQHMITMITHMRVREKNARAFEAQLAEMTRNVRACEPGAVHYELFRSADDTETYVVIEIYRDEAAVEAHRNTDYLRASIDKTAPLVEEGRFDTKRYVSP
jgi:quinol monooxygenase YgiN